MILVPNCKIQGTDRKVIWFEKLFGSKSYQVEKLIEKLLGSLFTMLLRSFYWKFQFLPESFLCKPVIR